MALTKDCMKKIYHKHPYIYTDDPRMACATTLSGKNPYNLRPRDAPKRKSLSRLDYSLPLADHDWKGNARSLFAYYGSPIKDVMCFRKSDDCTPPDPVTCRGRTRTRCTQTRYRESSAQTHAYLPEVAGDKKVYEQFEVYQISKLLDTCSPPGVYEAKVVERARTRRQFEKALKLVQHDKAKTRAILEAMEWQNWIAREEDIQSIQMLRMEIVLKHFKERETKFSETSAQRIEIGASRIQAKQKDKLNKINIEYLRAMRLLEGRRQNLVTNYRKGNIAENHVNPASDLRAPQMRFGVNPNRRHFVGFRKKFDDRINDLNKRKDERGLSGLECPFAKLRTWAKPKERMKEVSQRFCSEENLKNLYESLKGLRTIAEAQKPSPQCLKRKQEGKHQDTQSEPQPKTPPSRMTEKCAESVEFVSFTGVDDGDEEKKVATEAELLDILRQRRNEDIAQLKLEDKLGVLAQYAGSALGQLLKSFSDELQRLKQMKKFQAIQMIAERERWRRESAESGQRQKEDKFREDNEVLYAATSEVHKDLSTSFLKSVLEEEFEFSAEALASEKIAALAKVIDKHDLDCIKEQGRHRRVLSRAIIADTLRNQVFKVAEKELEKKQADLQLESDLNAMTEELFNGVENVLQQKYKTADSIVLVGELLDELIADAVTYDFGLFTPDTSDDEFYPDKEIGAIVDKVLKMVIRLPGVKEDFTDASDWIVHLEGEREAAAVIRKVVRSCIRPIRWKSQSDRIVEETLSDTFNAAVYEVECLKTSRIVRADDRLKEAISQIYRCLNKPAPKSNARMSVESELPMIDIIPSAPSTFELFDYPPKTTKKYAHSELEYDDFSEWRLNYVNLDELTRPEPVELDHRRERYDILGVYQKPRFSHRDRDEDRSSVSSSLISSSLSAESVEQLFVSYSLTYMAITTLHPDLAEPFDQKVHQMYSSRSYVRVMMSNEKFIYDMDKSRSRRKSF